MEEERTVELRRKKGKRQKESRRGGSGKEEEYTHTHTHTHTHTVKVIFFQRLLSACVSSLYPPLCAVGNMCSL